MKGAPAREHLVENRPEGEDVGLDIRRPPPRLLRRHVVERSHHRPGHRLAGDRRGARLLAGGDSLNLLREAEVEDLHLAVPRYEQVVGLQVPMDDTPLVSRGEAPGDL